MDHYYALELEEFPGNFVQDFELHPRLGFTYGNDPWQALLFARPEDAEKFNSAIAALAASTGAISGKKITTIPVATVSRNNR